MRKKRSLTAAQGNGAGADAMQRVSYSRRVIFLTACDGWMTLLNIRTECFRSMFRFCVYNLLNIVILELKVLNFPMKD